MRNAGLERGFSPTAKKESDLLGAEADGKGRIEAVIHNQMRNDFSQRASFSAGFGAVISPG
ncbi:hypothetical protein [Mesorhizobium huakuii]|uniref:Uncharacterized protein n=1 Tax=Mesorhizobium huakuii TaxID=28104 RepID=A0A7G6SQS4_9HYPH|nr:hypothetical protein [Mesorhizobium huakuii]QND56856.1 hypothetical protein HB778_09675 [Mesorhizobium huakuii]